MRAPTRILVAAAIALAAVTPAGAQASAAAPVLRDCQVVPIPVSLGPGQPLAYQVSGQYCVPYGRQPSAVDVLVPGATYGRVYWDSPVSPPLYSFVGHDLQAGRATLAIDRIGTGASSKPASTDVTLQADAWTLHQVITWARAAAGYRAVNVIGHSLGSFVASLDASEYPGDPSALVLTGMLHKYSTANLGAFFASDMHPAGVDPVLAGTPLGNLPDGYLTTVPGIRGQVFYYNGASSVVAWDEARKDVISSTEATNGGQPLTFAWTTQITAPVLLVVGQDDHFFCQGGAADCSSDASVYSAEQPWYPSAASLSVDVVPGTGHDVALSRAAGLAFLAISFWLRS